MISKLQFQVENTLCHLFEHSSPRLSPCCSSASFFCHFCYPGSKAFRIIPGSLLSRRKNSCSQLGLIFSSTLSPTLFPRQEPSKCTSMTSSYSQSLQQVCFHQRNRFSGSSGEERIDKDRQMIAFLEIRWKGLIHLFLYIISTMKSQRFYILIPLTIPSSGKSTIFGLITKLQQANIFVVSSDSFRSDVMREIMAEKPELTKSEAYKLSKEESMRKYFARIGQILSQACCEESYLFLDRNHHQEYCEQTLKFIESQKTKLQQTLEIITIGLIPDLSESSFIHLGNVAIYPFSMKYVACCLKRILNRKQHETLVGDDQYRLNVCIQWCNYFKNMNILQNFDALRSIPFYCDENQIPVEIQEVIMLLLKGHEQNSKIQILISHLKKWEMKENSPQKITREVKKMIKSLEIGK